MLINICLTQKQLLKPLQMLSVKSEIMNTKVFDFIFPLVAT